MPLLGTRGAASAQGFGLFGGLAPIGAPYWMGTYGPQASTQLRTYGLAVDTNGNLYCAGYGSGSFGCYVTKYNSSGAIQWQKRLSSGSSGDYFFSIALDSANNVYVGGATSIGGGNQGLLIAKYDTSGTLQWQRKTGGSTYGDRIQSIAVDSSGNIYFAGYSVPNVQYAIVGKYDSTLTQAWGRRVGNGGETTFFNGVTVDGSGNVYAVGNWSGGSPNGGLVAKYSSSGALTWMKALGDGSVYGNAVAVDPSGNVYVSGSASGNLIFKYNSSGTLQWQRLLSGSQNYGIGLDSLGNVYACGFDTASPTRMMISKYNASGTIQWQRYINNASNVTGWPMTIDRSDNVYVGGWVPPDGAPSSYGFFAKLPSNGSKTGTYSIGGSSFQYLASSYTASTPTFTDTSQTLGNTSRSDTFSTTTLTDSTPSITSSVTTI